MVDANSKVEMKKKRKLEDDQQHTTDSTSSRISFPPDGYICNLCQQTGHWIQRESKDGMCLLSFGIDQYPESGIPL